MINTSIIWCHLCKFVSFCEIEKEYKNVCTDVTVTKMVKKYEGKSNNTRKEKWKVNELMLIPVSED